MSGMPPRDGDPAGAKPRRDGDPAGAKPRRDGDPAGAKPPAGPGIADHALEFVDEDRARALEDTLWWSVGRQSILRQFLDLAARSGPLERILEVGCGSGGNFALLAEYGEVIGCERSETLARRARERGIAKEVHGADFFELDLSSAWKMTCMYDVLEHIEDDGAFLRRLGAHVDPGHFLLLSVPACPFLYSQHDRLLHHYRRYTKRGLEDLLRRNGFRVLRSTCFVTALFPVVALLRMKEKVAFRLGRVQTEVNLGVVPPWLNRVLIGVLRAEAAVARVLPLPVGVWVIALARRE